MRKTKIILTFILIVSLGGSVSFAGNYSISWYTFAQGGGTSGSGNYGLSGIIEYGAFGSSSSQNYGIGGGFLQVMSLLGLNTYLGDELKVYNFPNPFNPLEEKTTIKYFLPGDETVDVMLRIYTISGELVCEIDEGEKDEGYFYFVDWDGTNDDGERVASGVYILLIKAGSKMTTFKIAVIK